MNTYYTLASDNFSGAHPTIIQAISEANIGHAKAYGEDSYTQKMEKFFKQIFGKQAQVFLIHNGTAANVCIFKQILRPWEAILCPDHAHIWVDECGATQAISGNSLITIPTVEGKIDIKKLEPYMSYKGNPHHVQPKLISITQSTELGTVYSIEELKDIKAFAKQHNLYLHIDGARLSNAAASLGVSLKAISTDIGVDVISFGGTKNGLMGVDAIVFLNPELAHNFEYMRKQNLQLASKMRYLSAQMHALLKDDLWLKNASHANQMAKYLEMLLQKKLPQFTILYPVQANSLFVKAPSNILNALQKKYFFWMWDEHNTIGRFMTTWDTSKDLIDGFVDEFVSISNKLK